MVHHNFQHEHCHLGVCPIFRHPRRTWQTDVTCPIKGPRGGQECEKHHDRVFPAETLNCSWWRCGRKLPCFRSSSSSASPPPPPSPSPSSPSPHTQIGKWHTPSFISPLSVRQLLYSLSYSFDPPQSTAVQIRKPLQLTSPRIIMTLPFRRLLGQTERQHTLPTIVKNQRSVV